MMRIGMILALFSPLPLAASSCRSEVVPPCELPESWTAFVGVAVSKEIGGYSARTRFAVATVFQGVPLGTTVLEVEVPFQTGEPAFRVGEPYLVFAYPVEGRLVTNECAGSLPLPRAARELEFADAWRRGRARTTIRGQLIAEPEGQTRLTVRILGPNGFSRDISPNTNHEFFAEVPGPGRYTALAVLPDWIRPVPMTEIDVPAQGCVYAPLYLLVEGRVEGRVLEADGLPAAGVEISLLPLTVDGARTRVRTDPTGAFQSEGMPSGPYRLGIHIDGADEPSAAAPFAPTCYPGVIHVPRFATRTVPAAFRLPPRLRPRTIRVTAAHPDGTPIEGVTIACELEGRATTRRRFTDARGETLCPAMSGLAYTVAAGLLSNHRLARSRLRHPQPVRVAPGTGEAAVRLVFR